LSGVAKEKSEIPNMKNIKTQPQLFYVPMIGAAFQEHGFGIRGIYASRVPRRSLVITPK